MVQEFLHQEIACKNNFGLPWALHVIRKLRETVARQRERGKGFKVVGDGCLTFGKQSMEDEEPTANTT